MFRIEFIRDSNPVEILAHLKGVNAFLRELHVHVGPEFQLGNEESYGYYTLSLLQEALIEAAQEKIKQKPALKSA